MKKGEKWENGVIVTETRGHWFVHGNVTVSEPTGFLSGSIKRLDYKTGSSPSINIISQLYATRPLALLAVDRWPVSEHRPYLTVLYWPFWADRSVWAVNQLVQIPRTLSQSDRHKWPGSNRVRTLQSQLIPSNQHDKSKAITKSTHAFSPIHTLHLYPDLIHFMGLFASISRKRQKIDFL